MTFAKLPSALRLALIPILALGLSGCIGDDKDGKVRPLSFSTYAQGDSTRYPVPPFQKGTAVLIRSQQEWSDFRDLHRSYFSTPPPVLVIDFSSRTMIAVISSGRPTLGYPTSIVSVRAAGGLLLVEVVQENIGSPVAQATNPYHIVMIEETGFFDVQIEAWID